jgi:hypothetical protein
MYPVLENAVRWLFASSADPSGVSMTIRGILVGFLPAAMVLLNLAHINVGQDQATAIVDGFVNFVQAVLTVIASAHILLGIVRKTWNTSFPQYAF